MLEAVQLKDGVYWVGAVDWNIREFHGYSTSRGTTYNAYLIKGERDRAGRYRQSGVFPRDALQN